MPAQSQRNTSTDLSRRAMLSMTGAAALVAGTSRAGAFAKEQPLPATGQFAINVPQSRLDSIRARVRAAQLPSGYADGSWSAGPPVSFMRALQRFWVERYDWRKTEARLNAHAHFRTRIDGEALHYMVEQGSGPAPRPLLLLHGWPHNFVSFLDVVEPLAHPERFGGSVDDAFTVIVPSLPGTGFSDAPKTPLGPKAMARRLHKLMANVLGHDRYMVHGGDWGALIGSWMAVKEPQAVIGLHLNHLLLRPEGAGLGSGQTGSIGDPTDEERDFLMAEAKAFASPNASYFPLQSARPLSIAYAMADSPMGWAGWLVDKYAQWVDTRQRPFPEVLSMGTIIDQLMADLVAGSSGSSMAIYSGAIAENPWTLPKGVRVNVPTGFAAFLDPFIQPPPRSLANRSYNVVSWQAETEGGHWPALERPDRLVQGIRAFSAGISMS